MVANRTTLQSGPAEANRLERPTRNPNGRERYPGCTARSCCPRNPSSPCSSPPAFRPAGRPPPARPSGPAGSRAVRCRKHHGLSLCRFLSGTTAEAEDGGDPDSRFAIFGLSFLIGGCLLHVFATSRLDRRQFDRPFRADGVTEWRVHGCERPTHPTWRTLSSIFAVILSGGHLDHLAAANMSPVVVEAGRQLQAFHRAVINEREL